MTIRPAVLLLLFPLAACMAAENAPAPQATVPTPPPVIAPAPPPAAADAQSAACPLTITFASYGAGTDGPARERITALLVGDRVVTGFDTRPWGREGEATLCVRTRTPADSARLFERARALVPPRPRGPISLATTTGLRYETPPLTR